MKRKIIAVAICGGLAATAALAQGRGRWGEGDGAFGQRGAPAMSPADREAYLDARIAALKAGLKLTPDQDRMWPPVEDAMRGVARQRAEARRMARERWAAPREPEDVNIPDRLRALADRQAASSDALRKLADASAPLYATLDPDQKRRLAVLTRGLGGRGGMGGGPRMRHGMAEDGSRDFAEAPVAR